MKRSSISVVTAFVVGLSIGAFAASRQQADMPPAMVEPVTAMDSATALATVKTSLAKTTGGISGAETEQSERDGIQQPEQLTASYSAVSRGGQMEQLTARWSDLQSLVDRLASRVSYLEQELETIQSAFDEEGAEVAEVLPVATPEQRRTALLSAGVPHKKVESVLWQQSELELERLELQDQAIRDGWYRTERYYQALRELNSEAVDLRVSIGDQAYDSYLYQTGENNRVKVASVIAGSSADFVGLVPGDIVMSYGDKRIYDYADLRDATSEGTREETVSFVVKRGDSYLEMDIPRGPIGVRLEGLTAPPES